MKLINGWLIHPAYAFCTWSNAPMAPVMGTTYTTHLRAYGTHLWGVISNIRAHCWSQMQSLLVGQKELPSEDHKWTSVVNGQNRFRTVALPVTADDMKSILRLQRRPTVDIKKSDVLRFLRDFASKFRVHAMAEWRYQRAQVTELYLGKACSLGSAACTRPKHCNMPKCCPCQWAVTHSHFLKNGMTEISGIISKNFITMQARAPVWKGSILVLLAVQLAELRFPVQDLFHRLHYLHIFCRFAMSSCGDEQPICKFWVVWRCRVRTAHWSRPEQKDRVRDL